MDRDPECTAVKDLTNASLAGLLLLTSASSDSTVGGEVLAAPSREG